MYYQVGNYLFKTIEMVVLTAKDLPFQVTGLIFLVFLRSWDMKKIMVSFVLFFTTASPRVDGDP